VALATYTDLLAALPLWAMRTGDTEFTTAAPDFVTLAEARLNRILRAREMETSATLTVSSGAYPLPADYIEARRVAANTDPVVALKYITPDQATEAYAGVVVTSGYPESYTTIGSSLYVYSTTTATVALDYFQKIPALSVSNTTNWLLTKAPDVYLFASLVAAEAYMVNDSRVAGWKTLVDEAIKELHSVDLRANYSRASAGIRGATP
jgi:hypothetical protein